MSYFYDGLDRLVLFSKLVLIAIWELAKFLPIAWISLISVTMLWGALYGEWLDESIGGQAMFILATWPAFLVSAKLTKRQPAREAYRLLSRGAGITALLLTGAAMINMVFPNTFPLNWPMPDDLHLHITPIAVLMAVAVLQLIAFWAQLGRKS